jgi:hypothetical protein
MVKPYLLLDSRSGSSDMQGEIHEYLIFFAGQKYER